MNIECIYDQPALLGEGPLWHPQEHVLYWVDIVKPALHRLDPKTKQHQSWFMPSEIGCIGLRAKGGLIAALRTGFAIIELPSGETRLVNEPIHNKSKTMFNDGKGDRQGRFWAGTKDVAEQAPLGSIYRLDANGECQALDHGFTVSNGLAWSPDNSIMYICDSPARVIYQYDFNPTSGAITNKKIFVRIAEDAGYPDGLTVDKEGYLWSAHWDGWRITRYAPNGAIDRVIEMPVQRPTSCCFGGPKLSTLYVTSASVRLTPAELNRQPLAGCVFAIETTFQGIPEPFYQG